MQQFLQKHLERPGEIGYNLREKWSRGVRGGQLGEWDGFWPKAGWRLSRAKRAKTVPGPDLPAPVQGAKKERPYKGGNTMAINTDNALRRSVIYEVYVRSHTPEGTFKAIEPDLDRIAALGVDIVWFMPIHPIGEPEQKRKPGLPLCQPGLPHREPGIRHTGGFSAPGGGDP